MTSTWSFRFNNLFGSLSDDWNLVKEDSDSLVDITSVAHLGWKKFQDKAKVKFDCSECDRCWTSVKGTVIFHYRLRNKERKGQVKMWTLGQKCNECEGTFEPAKWYGEEIEKVLGNLLSKVKEKFYYDANQSKKSINKSQRQANMTSEHKSELCQACQQGVCPLSLLEEEEFLDNDEDEEDYDDYRNNFPDYSQDDEAEEYYDEWSSYGQYGSDYENDCYYSD